MSWTLLAQNGVWGAILAGRGTGRKVERGVMVEVDQVHIGTDLNHVLRIGVASAVSSRWGLARSMLWDLEASRATVGIGRARQV